MQRINHTTKVTIAKATTISEKSRVKRLISYGLGRLGFATSVDRIERELKQTEREILACSEKKEGILKHHLELEPSEAPAKKRRIYCSPLQFLYEDAKPYKKQLVRRSANLTEVLFFIKLPPTMQRYICSFLGLEELVAVMLTSVDLYQLVRYSKDMRGAFAKNSMQLVPKNYSLFERTTIGIQCAYNLFKRLPDGTVMLGFKDETAIDVGVLELKENNLTILYQFPSLHFNKLYAELVLDQKILVSCTRYGDRFCAIDVATKEIVAEFKAPVSNSKLLTNGQIASWGLAEGGLKIYECKFNSRDQQYFFDLVQTIPLLTYIFDIIAIKDYYIVTDYQKTHSIHAQTKEYKCIFNSEEDSPLQHPLIELRGLSNDTILLRLYDCRKTKYDLLYVINLKNMRDPKIKKIDYNFQHASLFTVLSNKHFAVAEQHNGRVTIWNADAEKAIKTLYFKIEIFSITASENGTLVVGFQKGEKYHISLISFKNQIPAIAPEATFPEHDKATEKSITLRP